MSDQTHDVAFLLARIERLETELADCKAENVRRSQEVAFLTLHPTIAAGMRGERLVAKLLKQPQTIGNAPYDIGGEVRVEVKTANLTYKGKTGRWTWGRVFGMSGKKDYRRLILIGVKDNRHISSYIKSSDPYVFFDVPYEHVEKFTNEGGKDTHMIRLSSNPRTVRSVKVRPLYTEYQVTAELIESTYELRVAGRL